MARYKSTKIMMGAAFAVLTVLPALAMPAFAPRTLVWGGSGAQNVTLSAEKPAIIVFSRSGNVYVANEK